MKKRQAILIVISFMMISMVLTACKKSKNNDDITDVNITPTVTPTQLEDPSEDNQGEDLTDEPLEDPKEDNEETIDPIVKNLSEVAAEQRVLDEIGERGYFVSLLDENFSIDETEYYLFQISDSSSVIEPNVVVDKISGEVLCYYNDGTTGSFIGFPLSIGKTNEKDTDDTNVFTKEDAFEKLSKVSAETLGLPVELNEYTIIYDDWLSVVKGKECYGINAFAVVGEKRINMGGFYVAVDGSAMYKFDYMLDDFAEITE